MYACNSDRVIKFAHNEKSELYLQRQRREGWPGSLEKLDDGAMADQCYFFSSVLSLISGSLERNWSMLVLLHSFSGFLMLFVPSLCLPSAGNGNLYWTLLSVEARMLDTASATHNGSLLRRGCMLVAVVTCWEELLLLVADGVAESQVAENSIAVAGKEVAAGSTTAAEGRCGWGAPVVAASMKKMKNQECWNLGVLVLMITVLNWKTPTVKDKAAFYDLKICCYWRSACWMAHSIS